MNYQEKLQEFIDSLPKEVRENYEQRKDEYLTLQYVSTQVLDRILRTYLFNTNTRHQKKLKRQISERANFYCEIYQIPHELYEYIAEMALNILTSIGKAIKDPAFKKWFAELKSKANQTIGKEESSNCSFLNRPLLEISEDSTEEEIKEAVRKDLLTMLPEEKVNEMIKHLKIGKGRAYLLMESVNNSSYNKGRKKDEDSAKS